MIGLTTLVLAGTIGVLPCDAIPQLPFPLLEPTQAEAEFIVELWGVFPDMIGVYGWLCRVPPQEISWAQQVAKECWQGGSCEPFGCFCEPSTPAPARCLEEPEP